MRYRVRIGVAAAAFSFALPAYAVPVDFADKARAVVADSFPADGPGATIIVTEHGKPVFAAGRGMASLEKGTKLDAATPMRLGSITKQFTAAIIMQLVDEGKVSLDDPVSKFIPDYPGDGAKASVRQLLNHTSGIKSYTSMPGFFETNHEKPYSPAELIDSFKNEPLDFPVGSKWLYNNSGYVLLGAIIEKVTGMNWAQALDTRIAQPLGLRSLRSGPAPNGEVDMAIGYRVKGDNKAELAPKMDMTIAYAAGALVMSASDLARWLDALHGGKVVSAASYQAMTTPREPTEEGAPRYGFGLFANDIRGHKMLGHGGNIYGFSTDSLYLPEDGIAVAVLSNNEQPSIAPEAVSHRLAALAIGKPYESFVRAKVDPVRMAPLLGIYKSGEVERVLMMRDGKLYTRRNGGTPFEVTAASDGRFFYGDSLTWFAIDTGADGKPNMAFHPNGTDKADMMVWTGPLPPQAPTITVLRSQLDRLSGAYQGPVPILVAVGADGRLALKFGSQDPTKLDAETPMLFRSDEANAKVRFEEKDGKIVALIILQGGQELKADRAD